MPPSPLSRVRKICLGFPEAHEVEAWEAPTFRLNNKLFAMYEGANSGHGNGQPAVWIKSTAINQELLIARDAKRFFSPPYVGPSGWIGVRLGGRVSWRLVAMLLRDGYDLLVASGAATRARTKRPRSKRAPRIIRHGTR
jgi:predicted DNA-binding protein (MmcQ/YjbR family)